MKRLVSSSKSAIYELADYYDPYVNPASAEMDLSGTNGHIRLRNEDRPVLRLASGKDVVLAGLRYSIIRSSMKRTYLACHLQGYIVRRSKDGPLWLASTDEMAESASVWFSKCFPLTLAAQVVDYQSYHIAKDVWGDYKEGIPDRLEGYIANNPYWGELFAASRIEQDAKEQRRKEIRWKLLDAQLPAADVFKHFNERHLKDSKQPAAENPVQEFKRLRSEFLKANRGAAPCRDPLHHFRDTWFAAMYASQAEALAIKLESAKYRAERYLHAAYGV